MNGLAYIWKRILNYFHSIIGTENMGTTATTVKGAIAEHEEDISALGSKTIGTITGTYIDSPMPYEKIGNLCIINIRTLKDLPNGEQEIGTMPTGYRPRNSTVEVVSYIPTNSGTNRSVRFRVSPDGKISVYNYGSDVSGLLNLRGQLVYICV